MSYAKQGGCVMQFSCDWAVLKGVLRKGVLNLSWTDHLSIRAAKPAEVCLWNVWWTLLWNSIWNLKFPDGKNLVKCLGRTFLPARKARIISERNSGQISEKISETSFQISRLFSETSFSRRALLIKYNSAAHLRNSLWRRAQSLI